MAKKKKRKIAVIDLETDPFLFGRKPEPFAAGFFDGDAYVEFWGADCVQQLLDYLEDCEHEYYIYAHNGGKFDFIYFVEKKAIENPVKVINGRIVSARLGRHILRDSYAILPMPLSAYKKDEIDYSNFEADKRDLHRADILHYLAKDCEYLYDLLKAFVDRFGVQLTIGGTAIKTLEKFHPFARQNARHDEKYRPYYFGGRVQCFERGHIKKALKVYDVNSMYPFVMSDRLHPTGRQYFDLDVTALEFDDEYNIKGFENVPYFITFTGENFNALPSRTKQGLDFNIAYGEFNTVSHEFKVAMKYGLIKPEQITRVLLAGETINFNEYVQHFNSEKINAKASGDKIAEIFAKFLLNSAYGKFGQNPDNFKDWIFRADDISAVDLINAGYVMAQDFQEIELWERNSESESYLDVATAASITSAARSVLLEAMQSAKGLVYCDTDSMICESYIGNIDKFKLGAWDLEKTGDEVYIYAKKIYALYSAGECVKLACKGVRMTGDDILKLIGGKDYNWKRDAPAFKMSGNYSFVERTLKHHV